MYEWIELFSWFVDAISMMAGDVMGNIYYYVLALILIALAITRSARKHNTRLQRIFSRAFNNSSKTDYLHSALKTCPKCAVQLPLSTLVCESCDYNFLAGCVGTRHKLLPAPESVTQRAS